MQQYNKMINDIKQLGYEGVEGAGTASEQWVKMIHHNKTKELYFSGKTPDECFHQIQDWIKENKK